MIKIVHIVITVLFITGVLTNIYDIFVRNKKNAYINTKSISNKVLNTNYIKKMQYYISYISKLNSSLYIYIKPISVIIFSATLSIIIFFITYKIINIFSSALVISIYSFFIPYYLIEYIYNDYRKRINNIFPTYIISLKNYTQLSNDIIIALKRVNIEEPLSIFINKFNLQIEKGINVYDAFETLKNDINIKKISEFITAVQTCYLNGGDFTNLLSKYSNILNKESLHKEKEKQDNFSSIAVLVILIIINIFIIITFVYTNKDYTNIITNTFIGRVIFNINIFSYILIFNYIKKLNKLEE